MRVTALLILVFILSSITVMACGENYKTQGLYSELENNDYDHPWGGEQTKLMEFSEFKDQPQKKSFIEWLKTVF